MKNSKEETQNQEMVKFQEFDKEKSYTFKTEEIKRARDCKELALLLPQLKANASTGRKIGRAHV